MRTRLSAVLLAGLAMLAAAPVSAQVEGSLPRFEDALCPGIVGLKVEPAEVMVGRIRANAEALGVRMADERTCEANLLIAFVPDGAQYIQQLRRDRGYLFAEMSPADREKLLAQTGPARAMLRIRNRTRDGLVIPRRDNLTQPPQTNMWSAHSLIYDATRNDIVSALVLFDRAALGELTVTQLADYATFRALSHALPEDRSPPGGSILALFGDGERPAGLTDFDRKFLQALYEGPPNLPRSAQLAALEAATGVRVAE